MVERQRCQHDFAFVLYESGEPRATLQGVGHDVAVAEHHPLGRAGGAAGVLKQRDIAGNGRDLIEVVSGMEYSRFLQARIFNPLRMKETTFWPDKKRLQKLATSYKPTADGKGLEPTPIKYLTPPFSNRKRTPLAAGGLFSTAEDLLKLYTMLLNGGEADGRRILSAAALKEMTTIQSDDLKTGFTEGMAMGLGFHIVREPTGVTAMLSPGTFGHGGAHGTQGWIDPERKTIYILLIQRAALNNGDASPMRQAFQQAIAEALPPVVKAAVKP